MNPTNPFPAPASDAAALIEVTPNAPALLNEPPLMLYPYLALDMAVSEALFMSQMFYWVGKTKLKADGKKVVRFSYTKWQRQFPFLTRTALIGLVARLEARQLIVIDRSKRINKFTLGPGKIQTAGYLDGEKEKFKAHMLVFPSLAMELGLTPSVVLQQVHIRRNSLAKGGVAKSYRQWRDDSLMFLSLSTIKRVFAALIADGYVLVDDADTDVGIVNRYCVNYERVKELMQGKFSFALADSAAKSSAKPLGSNAGKKLW